MSPSSIANPAWETIRGVSFSMLHGPTLVTIVGAHAAISEIDDVTPEMGGHLRASRSIGPRSSTLRASNTLMTQVTAHLGLIGPRLRRASGPSVVDLVEAVKTRTTRPEAGSHPCLCCWPRRDLGAQSARLANASFIMADPNVRRGPQHTNGPNLWGPDHWHPRAYKTQTLRARRRCIGSHFPLAS